MLPEILIVLALILANGFFSGAEMAIVASRRGLPLKGTGNAEALRDSLQQLGALGANDLLALEVIWQPEGAGEVLSSEELITAYPDLQHL